MRLRAARDKPYHDILAVSGYVRRLTVVGEPFEAVCTSSKSRSCWSHKTLESNMSLTARSSSDFTALMVTLLQETLWVMVAFSHRHSTPVPLVTELLV